MRTDKQNEASRNNGGKSQGPITPDGKAKSAQNAGRHNLCTGHLVLLTNEDPREFHCLMDDYMLRFQPIDGVELDLVHKMIAATWREKRVTAMETSLFELEMIRQQPDVDDEYQEITAAARQTLALFGTDDTKAAAALLYRYGSTVRRAYASAFRVLREIQGDRFNRPSLPAPVQQHRHKDKKSAPPADPPRDHRKPASANAPQHTALASFIVLRRRIERVPDSKNTELRNEPRHAAAAGHGALHPLVLL
jgi:hypothetical protein